MSDKPIHARVRIILDWWYPRIEAIFGSRVKSVVLFGSVAFNDFNPRWSDVDVCVLVDGTISDKDGARIIGVYSKMGEQFITHAQDGWESRQVVEGYYGPPELMTALDAKLTCCVTWGSTAEIISGNMSPFDRYQLAHFGISFRGEPAKFAPPARQDLMAHFKRDLGQLREHNVNEHSGFWVVNMLAWLARSSVFWREGELLSKRAALKREIDSGSPFIDAYGAALAAINEGWKAADQRRDELRGHFKRIVGDAASYLARFAE